MLYSPSDWKRVRDEGSGDGASGRSAFRRDYGRLLHSPSFRRLQGKTQLFPGNETDFFRNRLTHSLEVAQIAKGIALKLNAMDDGFKEFPIDTDLVELAGLAHDLGHPPFGHNGERALDECMKGCGGFEGNAQTLRILGRTENKVSDDEDADPCGISQSGVDRRLGLNLTFRSLSAVLKYDNPIPIARATGSALTKGYYSAEAELVKKIKQKVGEPKDGRPFKTVECQIMDLADDIAYSTYDLEDSMKGGFTHPLAIRAKLGSDPDLVERIFQKVLKEIPDTTKQEVFRTLQDLFDLGSTNGEDPGYAALLMYSQSILVASHGKLRTGFTSKLVAKFMDGIRTTMAPGKEIRFSKIDLLRNTHLEIESLKHLNFELMIMSPRLKVVEYRGDDLVTTIFDTLSSPDGHLLLPEDFRLMYSRLPSVDERKRLVCDFVAGMTDRYAIEFYSRLTESGTSIFKPI